MEDTDKEISERIEINNGINCILIYNAELVYEYFENIMGILKRKIRIREKLVLCCRGKNKDEIFQILLRKVDSNFINYMVLFILAVIVCNLRKRNI